MVSGGHVFALPADGLHVLIYDAASGVEVKRIPLRMFDNAQTLLGIVDDRMILVSDNTVYCVKWKDFDEKRELKQNVFWLSRFRKSGYPEDSIRGRGLVTTDSVYVPTAWGVHRIAMSSGKLAQTYPPNGEWDEDEGPGNVLVTPDRLIVAGSQRVTVYTDLQMAMAKLDAAVAAVPDQPEPRLRYAEIMSAAGRWDLAITKLDEAIAVLGGPNAMPASGARDRVFADALAFAQRVARQCRSERRDGRGAVRSGRIGSGKRVAAGELPVDTRRIRACPLHTRRLNCNCIRRFWGTTRCGRFRFPPANRAGRARRARLPRRRSTICCVAPAGHFTSRSRPAAEHLEAARTKNDPAMFLAVAREFPNANAAPCALLAAADAYESAGDSRLAAQVLREILFKYPDNPERGG